MEEKAFELYEPKVEGHVLRERVNESEQEFREKEGMLKPATERVQEARGDQIKKELTAARDLMEEEKK